MTRAADPVQTYKAQSRMLEWLRSLGHAVEFSRDPAAPKITSEMFPQKNPTGAPCEYCGQPMGTPFDPSRMGARIKLTAEGTAKWLRDQGMIAETRRAFAAWQAANKSIK